MLRKILASLLLFTFLWMGTSEAATYYFVATGNYSTTTPWAASSGGAGGAGTPGATDDVVFDASSGVHTLTIDGTSGTPNLAHNVTMTSPAALTITMGATAVWNVAGNWTAATGITFSPNAAAVLNLVSTSTGQTFTDAGYTYPILVFNGVGGGWTFQDTVKCTAGITPNITLTNGALTTGNQTVGSGATTCTFASNNSNTRSLTLGSSTWNVSGQNTTVWNITTSTGMTLSAASSTIAMVTQSGTITFQGGALTYGSLTLGANSTGHFAIYGYNGTNFTAGPTSTGWGYNTTGTCLGSNMTLSGTFTSTGTNATEGRSFFYSCVPGTPYTLSAATVTVTNTDFRDITGAGAGSWDFSALTTTANGDGGGNSGMIFTAPKNCYMKTAVTVNWSAANWYTTSGGSTHIPTTQCLLQDTAIFDANSVTATGKTITTDMAHLPSINWTGVLNTPAWNSENTLAPGANDMTGSLTMDAGVTHTSSLPFTIVCRSACSINGGGATWPANTLVVEATGTTASLSQFMTSSGGLSVTGGTLALAGFNWSGTTLAISAGTISGTGNLTDSSIIAVSGGTLANTGTISGTTYTQTGGTTTLGGTLTLTGATALSAGTLDMNANAETGSTTLAVSGSGTLDLSGQWVASSTITVSGGTVANTGASGELKSSGANLITFSGGTSSPKKITQAGASNIVVSGTGTLSMPTSSSINWTSGIFEVSGATAIFTTAGPVTGTADTLTIGAASSAGAYTFGN